jgi:hypothetical protein
VRNSSILTTNYTNIYEIRKDGLAVQSNGAHTNADETKAEVTKYESTVYGDEIIRKRLIAIVDKYPAIW